MFKKTNNMKLITFISAGVFIVLSAFIMKKEHSPWQSLYDVKWSLKKIYTTNGVEEVSTKAFIKFHRENKSAGGNGSCNSFGSNFTGKDNTVSFRNIFCTKMYWEGVQETENTFFKLLGIVNRFEVKEKTLLLYQDKELLLEFASE